MAAVDLTGDEEAICRSLALAAAFLRERGAERRRARRDQVRRDTALCFSGAAFLIILLL
jgi:stage III sporulation protein AB